MADKIIKGLSDGSDYNNITFSNVNNKPEEYTNVHSPLFNGDQLGFEVKLSYADGGFSKLINAITIDWQGAKMVNTARYLHLTDITLNNTSELIDIIERICMQLSNGTPIEPTWEITNIQFGTGATESLSVDYKKQRDLPTVYGIYTNEMSQEDRREITDGIEWSITSASGTDYIELTEDNKIRGKKAGNATITATYKDLSCNADVLVKQVNLSDLNKSGGIISKLDSDQKYYKYEDYNGQPIQPGITLQYKYDSNKYEELEPTRDYSINYSNNTGSPTEDVWATMTVKANSSGNYTGSLEYTFEIKHPKVQPDYYWYCGTDIHKDENDNWVLPDINENTIIEEVYDESLNNGKGGYSSFSTDTGWRKCEYITYNNLRYVYTQNARRDERNLPSPIIVNSNNKLVPFYVCVPSDLNLTVKNANTIASPVNTEPIKINNINFKLYIFNFNDKIFIYDIF